MKYASLLGRLPALGSHDSSPTIIRLSLSIVVIGIAVFGGRWLAALARSAPAYPRRLGHLDLTGKTSARGAAGTTYSAGRWLGRLIMLSVGLVAMVIILLIWFYNRPLSTLVPSRTLEAFLGALALNIIWSLLVFACMLGFGRLFQRMIEDQLIHAHVSRNVVLLAGRSVYIVSLVVGVLIILGLWGTSVVVPVAVGGALTVALTLALQDVLRNLVSGVYLLMEHPFVIGDRIMLVPYTGRVEDIQIRYTALRTEDNQRVLIPNSMLFTGAVVNLSAYDASRGLLYITVPDKGGTGLDETEEQIRVALAATPGIRADPPPQIMVNGTAQGKMQLQVVFWLPGSDQDTAAALYSQAIVRLRGELEGVDVTRPAAQPGPVAPV